MYEYISGTITELNPAYIIPLVEVSPGRDTAEIIRRVVIFVPKLGAGVRIVSSRLLWYLITRPYRKRILGQLDTCMLRRMWCFHVCETKGFRKRLVESLGINPLFSCELPNAQ